VSRTAWARVGAIAAALATTAFQILTEAHAVPAAAMSPPWLDGRPTLQLVAPGPTWRPGGAGPVRMVRFDAGVGPMYGVLEGETVHQLAGDLFSTPTPTGWTHALGDVRLLTPLGPDAFRRAIWAGPSAGIGSDATAALALLDASSLRGPGDVFSLSPTAAVRPVAGVVVGGATCAPEPFGVTAGIVAYTTAERPQLALGPCVARGLALEEVGVDGDRARALLDERRVRRGDVLLIPLGPAVHRPAGRGTGLAASLPGVGELRCGVDAQEALHT
jgi:hypothetical protein